MISHGVEISIAGGGADEKDEKENKKSMGGALYKEKCVHQANYKTEFFRGPPSGNMTALTTHTGRPFRHRTSTPSVPFGPRRRTSLVALTKFFVAPYFLVSLRVC